MNKANKFIKWAKRHTNINTKTIYNATRLYRNDPCPCGSGIKYKRCCALKKEISETELAKEENAKEAKYWNKQYRKLTNDN